MIPLLLLVFGFGDLNIHLDSGVFSGAQVKLLSKNTAIVGLGGPFRSAKKEGRDFTNTYTVLLVHFKKGSRDPDILARLEIGDLRKNRVDSESAPIFELSSNNKFLFAKPAEHTDLHVIEVSPDSLRLASVFNDQLKDQFRSLVSVVFSQFSAKLVLTYLVIDSKNQREECVIQVCDLEKDKLTIQGNWRLETTHFPIWKGCLFGQKYLALIGTQFVYIFNIDTGKLEKEKFRLWGFFRFGPPYFQKENCWFLQNTENAIQIFIAPPGEKVIHLEITKDASIRINKRDSEDLFGNSKNYSQIFGSSNCFVAKKTVSKDGEDLKINTTIHWNRKHKNIFIADTYFFVSPPSVVSDMAAVVVYESQEIHLLYINLEN